jgi:GT2 family glycosyltransferase
MESLESDHGGGSKYVRRDGRRGARSDAQYILSVAGGPAEYDPARVQNLSGVLGHGEGFPNLKELSIYGEPCQECKLLDGVLLAVRSQTLIEHDLWFDPRFKFDFYDLDFCRQAEERGLTMGTWALSIIHASAGQLGSPSWRAAYDDYLEKYAEQRGGGPFLTATNSCSDRG